MRHLAILGLLGAAAAASASPLRFSSGTSRVPLIELYTSEGCSSCPPADQWFGTLAQKPGLWKDFVPVEFHVNYWDGLGWKDRLSTRDFTTRQYAYSSIWGTASVYTPCFVRNGAEWKPMWGGSSLPAGPSGVLSVELGDDGVCLVHFQPGPGSAAGEGRLEAYVALLGGGLSSKVTAGENGGRTLTHEFVAIGLSDGALSPDSQGDLDSKVPLPTPIVRDAKRRALAVWVSRRGDLAPIQATGGWLP